MIGFTTVRTGERAAVWNRSGEVRYVDGSRRLLLWRETVTPLALHLRRAGRKPPFGVRRPSPPHSHTDDSWLHLASRQTHRRRQQRIRVVVAPFDHRQVGERHQRLQRIRILAEVPAHGERAPEDRSGRRSWSW